VISSFFLGRFLAGDELDIVDQQHIGRAQPLLEAERVLRAHRGDELEHEFFGRHIDDPRARMPRLIFLPQRMHEVRLAEPRAAVEEERVEGELAALGHRSRRVVGDLIGLADDEIVEAVARFERWALVRLAGGRFDLGLRLGGRFDHEELGPLSRGRRDDRNAPDMRQHRAPCLLELVAEMGADPIGHEVRGRGESHVPVRFLITLEHERLQPAIEGPRAHALAQARADRLPCCLERSFGRKHSGGHRHLIRCLRHASSCYSRTANGPIRRDKSPPLA
jgi:hypothetical protein